MGCAFSGCKRFGTAVCTQSIHFMNDAMTMIIPSTEI